MENIAGYENSPNPEVEKTLSRFKGCLVGVAVADALGAPVEFLSKEEIENKFGIVDSMLGGGAFNWKKGEFTDDTDQTLAVVDSLITNHCYQPSDIAQRFLDWYRKGPKDVGTTTAGSLSRLEAGYNWQESGILTKPSNGSLMRTAPIGLFFRNNPDRIDQAAAEVSAITHSHKDCIVACQVASHLVAFLVNGVSREEALKQLKQKYSEKALREDPRLHEVLNGNLSSWNEGDALFTLSTAIRAFSQGGDFEDVVKRAIHAGGDTDTQAAVAGAFAGTFWGNDSIPLRWKSLLIPVSYQEIERKAEALYSLG